MRKFVPTFTAGIMAIIGSIAMMTGLPRTAVAGVTGAIYTTDCGSTKVNQNLFTDKQDVYLSGGPNNNQCNAGGISPDGDYYFQVTDPSGKNLLSSDPLNCRVMTVSGGIVTAYNPDSSCTPATAIPCGTPTDGPHNVTDATICGGSGKKAIQLFPFTDTPNNGGVYKMWMMPTTALPSDCASLVAGDPQLLADCGGSKFGFVSGETKIDVFKVKNSTPPPPPPSLTGEIDVLKFCDANANGLLDPAEISFGLEGWQIGFNPDPNSCSGTTDINGLLQCAGLDPGSYDVSEVAQTDFTHTATCVGGVCGTCTSNAAITCGFDGDCPLAPNDPCVPNTPSNPVTITLAAEQIQDVDFGNVGTNTLSGKKFADAGQDGVDTGGNESGIGGVKFTLSGTAANGATVNGCAITASDGTYSFPDLLPGTYTSTEVQPANTIPTTATTCTHSFTPDSTTCAGSNFACPEVGDVCLGAGGGLTLGFWSNKNGQKLFNASDLSFLSGLPLRNGAGTDVSFGTYAVFRSWLLSATATNMSYMLSAQLAAMELNVRHSKVSGTATVYAGLPPAGSCSGLTTTGFVTINALMASAITELGADGHAVAGDPERACQEYKKNALDAANNNKNFVVTCPATFGATCP